MAHLLTVFGAALLLGTLQDKVEEEKKKPEFKWDLKPEYVFELKWQFQETKDQKRPTGQGNESGSSHLKFLDKRSVEAEVTVVDDERAGPLKIRITKVKWDFDQPEYLIQLAYDAKKKTPTSVRTRVKAKRGSPEAARAQQLADSQADRMKQLVEAPYSIQPAGRQGRPEILRNKIAQKNSLFDRTYIYSKLPKGSVDRGQKWRGELTGLTLPSGLVEVKTIDYQVTSATSKGLTVKAGFTIPIVKPPTVTDQNTTGNYKYSREYTFTPEGWLSGSKETSAFIKKVTSKQKFFQEDVKVNMEQKLTLTKMKPRRGAK